MLVSSLCFTILHGVTGLPTQDNSGSLVRIRRQVDNLLPTDQKQEELVRTINNLPDSERLEADDGESSVAGVADVDADVPVVEKLPVADSVVGQEGEEGLPVASSSDTANKNILAPEVEQLPESARVADNEKENDEDEELLGSERVQEEVRKTAEELPMADRVEGVARRGTIPDRELPMVEDFPAAESVKENDKVISDLPIADKVEEYPYPEADHQEDDLEEADLNIVESLPKAERLTIEEKPADTMYADDVPAAVRIPPETQKTALDPERVVDGKITDDVDIEAVKQLDHWEPDQPPMQADRVQGRPTSYKGSTATKKPSSESVGSIPEKLDKIHRDISGLSKKVDTLLAGFAEEIRKLEKDSLVTAH